MDTDDGMGNPDQRQTQITQQMEVQKTCLQRMDELCKILTKRLDPAIRTNPPQTEKGKEDIVSLCRLAGDLRRNNQNLQRHIDCIDDLLERLEL